MSRPQSPSFSPNVHMGAYEHMPTFAVDRCLSAHNLADLGITSSNDSLSKMSNGEKRMLFPPRLHQNGSFNKLYSYGSNRLNIPEKLVKTIRFQVLVWHVGPLDVIQGQISMKFRITIFWNKDTLEQVNGGANPADTENQTSSNSPRGQWRMQGRHRAYQKTYSSKEDHEFIDVPVVSILNAVSFEIIGESEVVMLREKQNLMRWTTMYRATLTQDDIRVDNYPHDAHDIKLKIGIIQNRSKGSKWDSVDWKLALATEYDSQGSTRVPHGLLIDHVKIPEFKHDKKAGLQFTMKPLDSFRGMMSRKQEDQYLEVKLHVKRESTYYDKNIIPVLCALDIVASCLVATLDASALFQRGLLLLNIAFLELTTRMRVDGYLPNVGYQIKLQRVLNFCFFKLICLTLESCVVYYLVHEKGVSQKIAEGIDLSAVVISLALGCRTLLQYFEYIEYGDSEHENPNNIFA